MHILKLLVVAVVLLAVAACGGVERGGSSAPGAPQNPGANAGVQSVMVGWDAVAGASSYNIYWSTAAGVTKANGAKIPNATAPYLHSGLTPGTTYYYVITAMNAAGESAESAEVSATASFPSQNADLLMLTVSAGVLNPVFSPAQTAYYAMFVGQNTITVTPTTADPGATVTVNGSSVAPGQASGAIALSPGTNTITVIVTAQDNAAQKTYTIAARHLAQQAYIKSSNTGTADRFGGKSVALYGDTLAVAAYGEASNAKGIEGDQADDSATESGAVYVFARDTNGAWTQQAYIKSSNTGTGDAFGMSVALSGDTLAVGAFYEDSNAVGTGGDQADNSATNSGAVYVFKRTGGTWAQQAYIKSSNTGTRDFFGGSVALSGDTLAVGAFGEDSNARGIDGDQTDNSATDSGAVYVFTRTGTTWSQQAYIKSSNTGTSDYFGGHIALYGDTLAVAAVGEDSSAKGIGGDQADNSAGNSGAVYVFKRTGGTWAQQAYVKASNTEADDLFGVSVALSGDTLAVGAHSEASNATGIDGDQADNSTLHGGAVYVFARDTNEAWTQQAYIKASNTGAGDYFGGSVALFGDALAVGAFQEFSNAKGINGDQADNSAPYSGAVYVFTRTGTTWTQQAYVKASNTEVDDYFGSSVALYEDTLAVGAYFEDSNATGIGGDQADNSSPSSGAVYVVR